jgi:hypothetical protein
MKGHTTAWQRLPGSGERVNWNGSILRANEQAERLFALYVDRIFSQVRYHGFRFDLSTYPFSTLVKELSFQISKRVNNPKFRERPEEIATKIQAGYYAQFFKYASAPIMVLDTEEDDICIELSKRIERENKLRAESLLLLEAPND